MTIGETISDIAYKETRRLLGDAIAFRRKHPYYFFRIHEYQATACRLRGERAKALWHRMWRRYYWARAMATPEASVCRGEHPGQV